MHRVLLCLAGLALVGGVATGASGGTTQVEAARSTSAQTGLIAFLSARTDPSLRGVLLLRPGGLRVIPPNGRGLARLASRQSAQDLSWSPDGRRIALVDGYPGGGGQGLRVLDAHGTGLRRLTVNVGATNSPDGGYTYEDSVAWSPDGRRIAFFRISSQCTGCPVVRDVYVISARGGKPRRLTRTPDTVELDLAWSPDGRKIAFTTGGYWGEVFVMNADGEQRRHLTFGASSGYCAGPSWSPDGSRIALYCSRRTPGGWQIYVTDAQGGAMKQLTHTEASSLSPSWSPDGSKIAFTSNRDGHFQLYLMSAEGSGEQRLTRSRTADFHPLWQPGP